MAGDKELWLKQQASTPCAQKAWLLHPSTGSRVDSEATELIADQKHIKTTFFESRSYR